jgi:pSer/pThr/pTyr-binding forkhead associated (FHA) protein
MPITLIVRTDHSLAGKPAPAPVDLAGLFKLTFDGTQRVVIGRTSGCDVRLPDASVSLRHAAIVAKGADFVLIDEGSTNGTYVGGVRLAPRTSRILRSGDLVRVGRVWLEVRVDLSAVTRDVGAVTRELAFAMVSQALEAVGGDPSPKVRVVEGVDLGAELSLVDDGRAYVLGRGATCALPLGDVDASREHAQLVRRAGLVYLSDLGSKNGVLLGDVAIEPGREVVWKPALMVRLARTVLALEEPVASALAELDGEPDERVAAADLPPPPAPATTQPSAAAPQSAPPATVEPIVSSGSPSAPIAQVDSAPPAAPRKRGGWTVSDVLVMLAALSILGISVAGLVWLLKG